MKRILILLLLTFFPLIYTPAFAQETSVSVTIPVPSKTYPESTIKIPEIIYHEATKSSQPITWLLHPDVIQNATDSAFFKTISEDPTQEIALWIEITPKLLGQNDTFKPFSETRYLLNSYPQKDRKTLIDSLLSQYKEKFGNYPHTIAATYVDSYSLNHLSSKYLVTNAIFDLPPATNNTAFFPTYPDNPYLPKMFNSLIPASNSTERIPIVITKLKTATSSELDNYLNETKVTPINHLTISPIIQEEFFSATEISNFFEILNKPNIKRLFNSSFSEKLLNLYPETSPTYFTQSSNFLTYSSPFIYLSLNTSTNKIDNLTFLNHHETESYYHDHNIQKFLSLSIYPTITTDNSLDIPQLSNIEIKSKPNSFEYQIISDNNYLNLSPATIKTNLKIELPNSPQYSIKTDKETTTISYNSSWSPYNQKDFLFNLLKYLLLVVFIISVLNISPQKILSWIKTTPVSFLLIVIGSISWSLTTITSGRLSQYGQNYFGAHSHDATFHLSVIESLKSFGLSNPLLINTTLKNYHFLYDILLAFLSKTLNIEVSQLYFQFIPPTLALLIGVLSYSLLKRWKFSKTSINLSLIFLYFTGSLGHFYTLVTKGELFAGESIFWMQQNITTLINPPFALSLVILLTFLNLIDTKNIKPKRILLLSFLAGLLIQTKAYSAILLISALTIDTIRKPKRSSILTVIFSLIISFLIFLPTYSNSGSLFIFKPLWFVSSMFSSYDRLNLNLISRTWQSYEASGQYLKLFIIHSFGLALYFIGNLGIRLLSLSTLFSFTKSPQKSKRLVSTMIILGILPPIFFIQSGNSWNAIQFSYYSLIFLSLLLGPVIENLLNHSHKLPRFLIYIFLVVFLTLPTSIGSLKNYLTSQPSTRIEAEELRALDILKRSPKGIILVPFTNTTYPHPYFTPIPLSVSESTAYISALTAMPTYFSDEVNLTIMNYDFKEEKKNIQRFYKSEDPAFMKNFLKENKVDYVYTSPQNHINVDPEKIDLIPIFDSLNYTIYRHPL